MSSNRPSIPKGTRDFSPTEMVRRKHIFNTIEKNFQLFGYEPLETPAMENLTTLMGKYGEEGDKLLYKILNTGNFLDKIPDELIGKKTSSKLSLEICDRGLRYDLTVPFARYVVQHQNEITFPFKRYQIQPVWRADRPQKGRYREFYQCDVDAIGTNSLLNEIELVQIADKVFQDLKLKVKIKLNNRKILAGLAFLAGAPELISEITIAIDKLEKIGLDGVIEELALHGMNKGTIEKIKPVILLEGSNREKLTELKELMNSSETAMQGIEEMEFIITTLDELNVKADVKLDLSLARGLNYYTGVIIEVVSEEYEIGSICGGGRYDDLTGIFGLPDVSGVGISFGADRIYDVMNSTGTFPESGNRVSQILFVNFGDQEAHYSLKVLEKVRAEGIPALIYPEPVKMKKQLAFANHHNIPYVALIGEQEMKEEKITLKIMETGEQLGLTFSDLIAMISQ